MDATTASAMPRQGGASRRLPRAPSQPTPRTTATAARSVRVGKSGIAYRSNRELHVMMTSRYGTANASRTTSRAARTATAHASPAAARRYSGQPMASGSE